MSLFSSNTAEHTSQKELRYFPHVDALITKMRTEGIEVTQDNEQLIRIIFDCFLELQLANSRIHTYKGVSFPVTSIRVSDLAMRVLRRLGARTDHIDDVDESATKLHQEYIITGGETMDEGDQFGSIEESMMICAKMLPDILAQLQSDKPLIADDTEIINIGVPTNKYGQVSPEFLWKSLPDPHGQMAELYTEFVRDTLRSGKRTRPHPRKVVLKSFQMDREVIDRMVPLLTSGKDAVCAEHSGSDLPRLHIRAGDRVPSLLPDIGELYISEVLLGHEKTREGYPVSREQSGFREKIARALKHPSGARSAITEQDSLKQLLLKKGALMRILAGVPQAVAMTPGETVDPKTRILYKHGQIPQWSPEMRTLIEQSKDRVLEALPQVSIKGNRSNMSSFFAGVKKLAKEVHRFVVS